MEFSVPYNGDIQLIDQLAGLQSCGGSSIREVFLSGPQEHSGSGRIAHNGNVEQFSRAVDKIHSAGFRVNLVMNSTCGGIGDYSDQYADYLRSYVVFATEELGIEAMTIANPYLMSIVHECAPGIEISASVLGDIDCVERARAFERLGASVLTPDVSINRDLAMLERIKNETNLEMKLMVNEGCLHKCPYRKYHFNAMSHISANAANLGRGVSIEQFKAQVDMVAGATFFSMCGGDLERDPSQILKSGWIRPEDAESYGNISTFFKVSGRTRPTHVIVRMVRAYMERSWEGDLLDIMDSSLRMHSMTTGARLDNALLGEAGFFERVTSCKRDCPRCGFCDNLAKRAISYEGLTETKKNDRNFFPAGKTA